MHVMSLDLRGKEKLVDEIFVHQPNLLGTAIVLSKLGVPLEKAEEVFFILLVLYEVFQKRSGLELSLITEDMIEKANDNNTAMLKYLDKEGMKTGMKLIGKSMLNHPQKSAIAFVFGHLNEHGFGNRSKENEYCVRAAKDILDCFIEASALAQ